MNRLLLPLLLFLSSSIYADQEDFTTYSQHTANSGLTASSASTVTVSSVWSAYNNASREVALYKNIGNLSDLTVTIHFKFTTMNSGIYFGVFNLCATAGSMMDQDSANDGISVYVNGYATKKLKITYWADNTTDTSTVDIATNTDYYLTITRFSTTTSVVIYSDSDRTNILDNSMSISSGSTAYTYVTVGSTKNNSGTDDGLVSGTITTLDLGLGGGETPAQIINVN